jgi:small GTP-binding protein
MDWLSACDTSAPKPSTLVRAVMLGAYGVGKTSLCRRVRDDTFDAHESTTIGIDFFAKCYSDVDVQLNVWDTAGQERFHAISTSYYRQADVFLVVFSVVDQQSFEQVPFYLKEVENYRRHANIPVVIVGNMANEYVTDSGPTAVVARPLVTRDEAQSLAASSGVAYFEVSARTDSASVNRLFREVACRGKSSAEPRKTLGGAAGDAESVRDGLRTPPLEGRYGYCCPQ